MCIKGRADVQEGDIKGSWEWLLLSVHVIPLMYLPQSKIMPVFYLLGLDTEPSGMHF